MSFYFRDMVAIRFQQWHFLHIISWSWSNLLRHFYQRLRLKIALRQVTQCTISYQILYIQGCIWLAKVIITDTGKCSKSLTNIIETTLNKQAQLKDLGQVFIHEGQLPRQGLHAFYWHCQSQSVSFKISIDGILRFVRVYIPLQPTKGVLVTLHQGSLERNLSIGTSMTRRQFKAFVMCNDAFVQF